MKRGIILAAVIQATATVLFIDVSVGTAHAHDLQILAQVGDVIDGRTIGLFSHEYTNVAINNDREVAFFALADGPDGIGFSVFTQRRFIAGAGKVVDGTVPRFNDEDHQVDINSSGQVVYTAFLPQGGSGLFVNENLLLQPGDVVDGRTLTLIFRFPQINDSGTVVVDGWYDAGQSESGAIITQNEVLAHSGQTVNGFTLTGVYFPRIGNNGDVASFGSLAGADPSAIVARDRVILKEGDIVEDVTVAHISGLGGVTDEGETVMSIKGGVFPDWQEYVVTEDRVLFRPGDVLGGLPIGSLKGTNVVLNNRDELAILGAVLEPDGRSTHDALVAGGQLVAREGDMFEGRAMVEIFPNFDMNDLGDVAFRVRFDDGSQVVLLATVPEPAGQVLGGIVVLGALVIQRVGVRGQFARRHAIFLEAEARSLQLVKESNHATVSILERR